MTELSINKRMKVINYYLQGFSYGDIQKKAGVSKGTVTNVIVVLKTKLAGQVYRIQQEEAISQSASEDAKVPNSILGFTLGGIAGKAFGLRSPASFGFDNLLFIMDDPGHEEYQDMVSCLGHRFDPVAFSLAQVNRRLNSLQHS